MADIVVSILRQTAGVTQAGFGTALILTNTLHTYEEYSNLSELAGDFATNTTVYAIASALLGQDIQPQKFAVAGISYTEENTIGSETLTNSAGNTYDFANDNVVVNSIQGLSDGSGPIADADIDSIDYEAGTITFTGARTGSVTVTGYSYYSDPSGFSTLLNTLVADNRDFYAVIQEASGYAAQKEVSTWTATQTKIHFIRTTLLPAAYPATLSSRTGVYYHTTANEYAEAATAGKGLPRDPGSLTWKNQIISGVTANTITGANLTALEAGRFNTIFRSYGNVVTSDGFLQGTLFIDQTRSQDFVKLRMEENIASLLISNDKISYDDIGIAQVVSVVESTLNTAFENGIIASDAGGQAQFTVTSRRRADIPQADIDARVLRTVTFRYIEAGAIEGAEITGRIVASL